MKRFLGVDVGTTTITALVLDLENAAIVARATSANDTEITSEADRRLGRSEWDPNRILDRVRFRDTRKRPPMGLRCWRAWESGKGRVWRTRRR